MMGSPPLPLPPLSPVSSEAAKTNEGGNALKVASQFLRPSTSESIVPAPSEQLNAVKIVSEEPSLITPILSNAIETYFVDD